jgi:hypothetical protein
VTEVLHVGSTANSVTSLSLQQRMPRQSGG